MSTHAAIIIKTGYGYAGIYLHYDGYPDHALTMLQKHYNDPVRAAALIALGPLRTIAACIPGDDNATAKNTTQPMPDGDPPMVTAVNLRGVTTQLDYVSHTYLFDNTEWKEIPTCG